MGRQSFSSKRRNFRGKNNVDKKQAHHWKEFGEKHPIDDEDEVKNPRQQVSTRPAAKRGKFVKDESKQSAVNEQSDLSSSSESEAETEEQPYNQLLTMLKGSSKQVNSVSSDESEEESNKQSEESDLDEASEEENEEEEVLEESKTEGEKHWELSETPEEENESDDELSEDSDNELDDKTDSLTQHFDRELSDSLLTALTSPHPFRTEKMDAPTLGKLVVYLPNLGKTLVKEQHAKLSLADDQEYAHPGSLPNFKKELKIKSQLWTNFGPLSTFQKEMFTILSDYKDLYFPERTLQNQDQIRRVYCLHALNHALKTRNRVLQHNAKLKRAADAGRAEEYRDQGLVRPRVLIVVPLRNSALKIVHTLASVLLPPEKGQIMNKKRFEEEYGTDKKQQELQEKKKHRKPEDFEELFRGNIDDSFRIGISVSKRSLRLYTGFYKSDILIASPLGLRTLLADDFDFLSSIEMLIMDQTDVLLMQNWDHVVHLFDHLHLQPREQHDTDLSRVRFWALNGWAPHYRQTLFFSSTQLPEAVGLFLRRGTNFAGKVRVENPVSQNAATICRVVAQLPQAFRRFEAASAAKAADSRFEFFMKKVLPQYKDSLMSGTLIFVPSYFDYVRLRNYFHKQELNFAQACEYTPEGKLAQARNRFFTGKKRIMLYTERLHFYRRLTMKGIRHIIFYQLPTYPHFYAELCNLIQDIYQPKKNRADGSSCTCTVLYCSFDAPRLAAVAGSLRTAEMITSDRLVHMFVSGEK